MIEYHGGVSCFFSNFIRIASRTFVPRCGPGDLNNWFLANGSDVGDPAFHHAGGPA